MYAWKRGEEYLYIGLSSRGLGRVLSHNVIGCVEEIQDTDTIELWFFSDERSGYETLPVVAFEAEMIRKHRPRYNVTDNPDKRPRMSKKQLRLLDEKYAANERHRQNEEREWTSQSWEI